MHKSDDFETIRELCDDYYQQRLTKDEYRLARSALLKKIDREFNNPVDVEEGFLDKILSVFKNKDEEKIV